jgi:hypothetical protein
MENAEQSDAARNFDLVARHIGFGDPENHGLYFVGIEEGTYTYESEGQIRTKLALMCRDGDITYDPSPDPPNGDWPRFRVRGWTGQVPDWTAKVARAVSKHCMGTGMDWRTYREQYLWVRGWRVFNANLYPLPRQSMTTRPENYPQLFGVDMRDQDAYIERCRDRLQWLGIYWHRMQPAATICFGKSEWPRFREVFDLDRTIAVRSDDGRTEYYQRGAQKFILTTFFGFGAMSCARAKHIVQQLKAWDVSIP